MDKNALKKKQTKNYSLCRLIFTLNNFFYLHINVFDDKNIAALIAF